MVFTPQFKCKQIKLTHVSKKNFSTQEHIVLPSLNLLEMKSFVLTEHSAQNMPQLIPY